MRHERYDSAEGSCEYHGRIMYVTSKFQGNWKLMGHLHLESEKKNSLKYPGHIRRKGVWRI